MVLSNQFTRSPLWCSAVKVYATCVIVISAFCPHSSSKMTQSLLRDHMVSHYKKIYSAKGKSFE